MSDGHDVKIIVTRHGGEGSSVVVDGHDITSTLRGVRVALKVGQINKVWLEMIPSKVNLDIKGAEVKEIPHLQPTMQSEHDR